MKLKGIKSGLQILILSASELQIPKSTFSEHPGGAADNINKGGLLNLKLKGIKSGLQILILSASELQIPKSTFSEHLGGAAMRMQTLIIEFMPYSIKDSEKTCWSQDQQGRERPVTSVSLITVD